MYFHLSMSLRWQAQINGHLSYFVHIWEFRQTKTLNRSLRRLKSSNTLIFHEELILCVVMNLVLKLPGNLFNLTPLSVSHLKSMNQRPYFELPQSHPMQGRVLGGWLYLCELTQRSVSTAETIIVKYIVSGIQSSLHQNFQAYQNLKNASIKRS